MSEAINRLTQVMAKLRNPDGGCPWDLEQSFRTIAPHTLEETYEVVEAIENDDMKGLKEELGDLLFQVAFHAQMGKEQNLFDLEQIATHVTEKMIERHPHVFGDRDTSTANDVLRNWEADKAKKRAEEAKAENRALSALDGVNTALPAASRALKLQQRAARIGFDWSKAKDIIAKIREETDELETEIKSGTSKDAMEDELGDLFFALINLARHLEIDPETAIRRTNRKFERRFRTVESCIAADGRSMTDASLDEMEKIWNEVKAVEKKAAKLELYKKIEAVFSQLLEASAPMLSEKERAEVQRFIDVGEYGIALETTVGIYYEKKKTVTAEVFSLLERLALMMSMDLNPLLQRLLKKP